MIYALNFCEIWSWWFMSNGNTRKTYWIQYLLVNHDSFFLFCKNYQSIALINWDFRNTNGKYSFFAVQMIYVWYNPVFKRCPTDSLKPITGSRSNSNSNHSNDDDSRRNTSWKADVYMFGARAQSIDLKRFLFKIYSYKTSTKWCMMYLGSFNNLKN